MPEAAAVAEGASRWLGGVLQPRLRVLGQFATAEVVDALLWVKSGHLAGAAPVARISTTQVQGDDLLALLAELFDPQRHDVSRVDRQS